MHIMLMHMVAHRGCTGTATEPALKIDFGRKVPCHTRDPHQYCTCFFFSCLFFLQSDALVTELSNPVIKSDPIQGVVDKLRQLLNSVGH